MRYQSIPIITFFLAVLAACQSTGQGSNESSSLSVAGHWKSDPARMIRPNLDETFIFDIVIGNSGLGPENNQMDIRYFSTEAPSSARLIRQELDVSVSLNSSEILLLGSQPSLVLGPEIIGQYESDNLTCNRTTTDILTCQWGSDGHGNPLMVVLKRE